jgi:hypothetical protein
MAEVAVYRLGKLGTDIQNARGQSYDNGTDITHVCEVNDLEVPLKY